MKSAPKRQVEGRGLRVLVLHSAFNAHVVRSLKSGAIGALRAMKVEKIEAHEVAGAFELPLAALVAARSRRFDAVVALAAVIRGETDHYEHIARETARGLAEVARSTEIPVGFGVLTVREEAQARARAAAGKDNKGAEAARAAISQALLLARLRRAQGSRRSASAGRKRRS